MSCVPCLTSIKARTVTARAHSLDKSETRQDKIEMVPRIWHDFWCLHVNYVRNAVTTSSGRGVRVECGNDIQQY